MNKPCPNKVLNHKMLLNSFYPVNLVNPDYKFLKQHNAALKKKEK